jgi:hypothetical protein
MYVWGSTRAPPGHSRCSVESLDVGSNLVVGVGGVEGGGVEVRRPVGVVLEVVDGLQTQFGHGHGSELARAVDPHEWHVQSRGQLDRVAEQRRRDPLPPTVAVHRQNRHLEHAVHTKSAKL